ncbi:phosphonate ABC transporter ATP-binding protein [Roseateles oligotrophus]|uniref:Phosphonate ABC transporter ATP-binding protein n=1 Tax=Roseateles oligotrophus TaxID=1769250 RepID=A0ABT2Y8I3_9BURK|nr:phosphonate ABC transporter ATP-binding protein [Roseateles oligotrophus]MCV2366601.1 phosphonate ABC transporter ATP-binding protein [Roseateles oligotrophus]
MTNSRNPLVIDVQGLRKSFGAAKAPALRDINLQVRRGEMVALLGASGSGKSTLLRHLSGLHRADAGSRSVVNILGRELQSGGRLAGDVRASRAKLATVFQQFNLVERLPVMTNVLAGALHRLPLWRGLLGLFPRAEQQRAYAALARVGIEACAWQRASTLSGGQQQRAAISRALVQGAEIILADEPIASLDPESSRRVMSLLAELNRELGVTVLVSLHQVDYAFAFCPRTVALRQGQVVFDGPTQDLTPVRLRELYGSQIDELITPVSPGLAPAVPAQSPSYSLDGLRAA